ncbi:tyrosine-type recombinase/integrase [Pikeienuella sp. HZG-20]|uniref:tyrosine-type recombinase/integrase n=1 Tax=Paludibacillus litoralis TaxID=3133267 RepID=UPI0030EE262A
MPKLTETYLKRVPNVETGVRKYWDTEVRGFGLFVGKKAKTFYYQRDIGGRTTRKLIGRHPVISAEAARQAAKAMELEFSRGVGRSFEIGPPTLLDALEVYLARPRLRSENHKENLRGIFHNHLGDWLKLRLDEIDRRMVVQRHAKLADRPSLANHLFRAFRTVWNHARRTCQLPEPPTIAIEWHEEEVNAPIIEDLAEWRRQVDALDNPIHAAFYRFILFTGFRKAEALTLRWRDVHADHIYLPMTKNGRAFDLPIGEIHHEILAPLRELRREWVFPSPKAASGHLANPARIDWSPHAHRRTFATVAVEAGVLEEIVGRLINHTPQTITGARYVKPSLDALRPAMGAASSELIRRIRGGI